MLSPLDPLRTTLPQIMAKFLQKKAFRFRISLLFLGFYCLIKCVVSLNLIGFKPVNHRSIIYSLNYFDLPKCINKILKKVNKVQKNLIQCMIVLWKFLENIIRIRLIRLSLDYHLIRGKNPPKFWRVLFLDHEQCQKCPTP